MLVAALPEGRRPYYDTSKYSQLDDVGERYVGIARRHIRSRFSGERVRVSVYIHRYLLQVVYCKVVSHVA